MYLFHVALPTSGRSGPPYFTAPLAGFMGVVFAEINYFAGSFLVTVFAVPEKVDVAFVVERYVATF
jgi:hypothetical protein